MAVADLAALFAGTFLLAFLAPGARSPALPALVAGMAAVLPLALLGLGLSGLLFPAPVLALLFLGAVAGTRMLLLRPPRLPRPLGRGWIGAGILFLLPSFIAALAPESEYDALRYHLALPVEYLAHHRVFLGGPVPFSGFPLGGEMLAAAGLCFGRPDPMVGALPAKMLNWQFLPLILVMTAGTARRLGMSGPGVTAAWLLLAASPLLSRLAGALFTDLLAAAAFAAAVALVVPRPSRSRAVAAGILLGAAGAAKFSAAALAPFVLPFLVPAGARLPAFAALGAMLLPPVARNLLFTGSPHGGIFWGGFLPSFAQADETLNPAAAARWVGWGAPSQWLWLPRYLLVEARAAGHELSPVLVALLPALALVRGEARRLAGASALALAAWAVLGGGQVRYLVPAMPLLALACASPLGTAGAPFAGAGRAAALAIAAAGAASLPGTMSHFASAATPLGVAVGSEPPRQYLARAVTPRGLYMAVGTWLAERPSAGRPYVAGDIKAVYWPRDPLVDSEYSAPFLFLAARDSSDDRRMRARFRQARIGCLVHRAEGSITFQEMVGGGYAWNDRSLNILQKFVARWLEKSASFERTADNAYYDIHMVRNLPRARPLPESPMPYTEALTLEGDRAFGRGDYAGARRAWAAAAVRFPRFALPVARMARADERLGHRDLAARERALAARLAREAGR